MKTKFQELTEQLIRQRLSLLNGALEEQLKSRLGEDISKATPDRVSFIHCIKSHSDVYYLDKEALLIYCPGDYHSSESKDRLIKLPKDFEIVWYKRDNVPESCQGLVLDFPATLARNYKTDENPKEQI